MHKQSTTDTGFTIVELLIVIVVIAILATISVVAYKGIQDRATNVTVEADISSIIKKLELGKVDIGHYPQSTTEFPDGFKFSKSSYDGVSNNVYYCIDKANDLYAFGLRAKTLKGYIISTGTVTAGVTGIYGSSTCAAISKTCVNDATTYCYIGYTASTSNWAGAWSWTN